jgi:chemotaxis protein MotA
MIVLLGIAVVLGAVMTGFTMAGGHVHALIHPSEIITIGGASLGALIASSPKRVLKDLVHGMLGMLKGKGADKQLHLQTLQVLYEFFRIARQDGMLAWEGILTGPGKEELFAKFPRVHADHHLTEFLCGALASGGDGSANPAELAELLETEIQTRDKEHHEVVDALTRTADALPGFGIVAAVLGIVITMQAINGPVEQIGHSVGAALVGTFLGILLSYGIIGPVAGRMAALGAAEASLFRTVAAAVVGFVGGGSPKAVLDKVRRGIPSDCRPTVEEMEQVFSSPTPSLKAAA